MLASRSSNARAQRKPTSPACFRVSLEPVPLNARFSVGKASLQRPCCARAKAFSAVNEGATLAAGVLLACAKRGGFGKKGATARASAILPEYLSMSSWRRALRTNRRTIFTQNKNEANGGERLPHYTWFVLSSRALAQTDTLRDDACPAERNGLRSPEIKGTQCQIARGRLPRDRCRYGTHSQAPKDWMGLDTEAPLIPGLSFTDGIGGDKAPGPPPRGDVSGAYLHLPSPSTIVT